jgi:hypothetical protein
MEQHMSTWSSAVAGRTSTIVPLPNEDAFSGIISARQPFGPYVTEDISNDDALKFLFDRENALHLEAMETRPAFIIGRRGSGKTALLFASSTHRNAVTVRLDTSSAFAAVATTVRALVGAGHELYTRHVSALWEAAIWHAAFRAMLTDPRFSAADDGKRRELEAYVDGLVPDYRRATATSVMRRFCQEVRARATDDFSLAPDDLDLFISANIFYADARHLAIDILSATPTVPDILVLMDSMEDFDKVVEIHQRTMEGLLTLLGERRRDRKPFSLRLCLPAELYHPVKEMSTNDLKDFAANVVLHWGARELVRVAARRLWIYVSINHREQLSGDRSLYTFDPDNAEEAERLLRSTLPRSVRNALGTREDALAYLLRHTQLLPRHFILLLNRVWTYHLAHSDNALRVSEDAVRRAVLRSEGDIVSEICKAYRPLYPDAEAACEAVIPHLRMTFSHSEFHRAFNQHGKSVTPHLDVHGFKRMLIEIGAVGRWMGETERYVEAEFEYTAPNRLNVSDDETMCLHPLFAGVYGSIDTQPGRAAGAKAVYPFGWDSNGPDYRLERVT